MALSPSERIRLMKDIARSIHDQDWGNANLIFDEFKVPHDRDGWGGDEDGYASLPSGRPPTRNSSAWPSTTT